MPTRFAFQPKAYPCTIFDTTSCEPKNKTCARATLCWRVSGVLANTFAAGHPVVGNAVNDPSKQPCPPGVHSGNDKIGIYEVQPSRPGGKVGNVVFLHGLQGGCDSTWRHRDGTYWPDLVAKDFPNLRVWTIGYDTSLVDVIGDPSVPIQSRAQIVGNLIYQGIVQQDSNWIVFVTHSMGGLIVKWIVLYSAISSGQEPAYMEVTSRIKGVIFCGVPHRGADIARAARILAALSTSWLFAKFCWLSIIIRLTLFRTVGELEPGATGLDMIHRAFVDWLRRPGVAVDVFSLIEQRAYSGSAWLSRLLPTPIIVPSHSARLDFGDSVPVPEDHSGLVKPSPANQQSFLLTHGRVAGFIRHLTLPNSAASLPAQVVHKLFN